VCYVAYYIVNSNKIEILYILLSITISNTLASMVFKIRPRISERRCCWYVSGYNGDTYVCACKGSNFFTCQSLPRDYDNCPSDGDEEDYARIDKHHRSNKYNRMVTKLDNYILSVFTNTLGKDNSVPLSLETDESLESLASLVRAWIAYMLMKKCFGAGAGFDKEYEPYLQRITTELVKRGFCIDIERIPYTCPWAFLKETGPQMILNQLKRLESFKLVIGDQVTYGANALAEIAAILDSEPVTLFKVDYSFLTKCRDFVRTRCGKGLSGAGDGAGVSYDDMHELENALTQFVHFRTCISFWSSPSSYRMPYDYLQFTSTYVAKSLRVGVLLPKFRICIGEFLAIVFGEISISRGSTSIIVIKGCRIQALLRDLQKKYIAQIKKQLVHDDMELSFPSFETLQIDVSAIVNKERIGV